MGFAGELATIGLSEVFQNVVFNRLTGVLTIQERDRKAAVLVDEGRIRAFTYGPDRPFDYAVIAERSGAVPGEVLRGLKKRRRRTLKGTLKKTREFDEAAFDAGVRTAIEEELILLFAWRNARFEFEEGRARDAIFDKEQLDCEISVDPQAVAMEAARRHDEWESISRSVGSEKEIFLAAENVDEEQLPPASAEVLAYLDGTRDIKTLVDELGWSRFQVMKAISVLVETGAVVRATAEHLRDLARKAQAAGEVNRAVSHIEAALEREGGDLESRRDLVRLYEKTGRKNDAAREHKRLAFAQEERGDLDAALESYERASVLVPYDTDTIERIAGIHDSRGDRVESVKAGRRLAEAFSSQGLHDDAAEVYQRLLERDEDSIPLREQLAKCFVKLHEPKKAAAELLVLARRGWAQGDYDMALHYYRNVLAVDRECEEASERIGEIESGRVRARKRVRRRRISVTILSILFAGTAWQLAREYFAYEAHHAAARASTGALAQNPADESLVAAIGHYARIYHEFPYTLGGLRAEETARALLLDELQRIQIAVLANPDAAERWIRRLAAIRFPEPLKRFWQSERDRMLGKIAKRRTASLPHSRGSRASARDSGD